MKIKVSYRLSPTRTQSKYCMNYDGLRASGDVLPDVMASAPAWMFPIIDRAFVQLRDARKWALHDKTLSVTLETK